MIDITICPSQVDDAMDIIRDCIKRRNWLNDPYGPNITPRHYDGRFMATEEYVYVIDNRDEPGGEFFLRVEFDDDRMIADDLVDHFGDFNVAWA